MLLRLRKNQQLPFNWGCLSTGRSGMLMMILWGCRSSFVQCVFIATPGAAIYTRTRNRIARFIFGIKCRCRFFGSFVDVALGSYNSHCSFRLVHPNSAVTHYRSGGPTPIMDTMPTNGCSTSLPPAEKSHLSYEPILARVECNRPEGLAVPVVELFFVAA